jgi:hypothetical protein
MVRVFRGSQKVFACKKAATPLREIAAVMAVIIS